MTDTKTKELNPATKAARAFNKIDALRAARDLELASAPAQIAAKYEEKIARVMSDCDDETKVYLVRLLG